MAELKVRATSEIQITCSDDAAAEILELAKNFDLMLLGLISVGWRQKVFGPFALRIARETPCATIFLSRRRYRALNLLESLRNDVVDSLRDATRFNPSSTRQKE